MDSSVVTRYRRTARLLAGEVVGGIEPCPPGSDDPRSPVAAFVFCAAIAAFLVGAASGAWTAPIPGLFHTVADPHGTMPSLSVPTS